MHCFPIFIQLVFICRKELLLRASVCYDEHARARTHAHAHAGSMTVCLMGLELGVMISPESAEPWAEAALTAAEPQVGQHGTTALGMHSCPPNPPLGSAANPVDVWLRCVWSKIRPFTASAPINLWICGILLLHHTPLVSYQAELTGQWRLLDQKILPQHVNLHLKLTHQFRNPF